MKNLQKKHNIALLELEFKMEFSSTIYPICLGEEEDEEAGSPGFVTGWGSSYFGIVFNYLKNNLYLL